MRWPRPSRRATRWSSCSPPAAVGRQKVSSTRMATRWLRCGPVSTARCIDADTRLYLPMPFFWVGGFGSGVLSALLAGATLVTEEIPQPETTLRLLERERVTLFRGWPDQAEALARQSASVGADLSALRPGSLEALLPPEQRAEPGARAKLFGMTESFGPYCGYPADTDMPRSAWGSCGKPFDGMQVRIVDPDTGQPVPAGTIGHDPDPGTAHVARYMPARPRRRVHARRLLPHRRPRAPRRRRLHVLPRPIRRHVQGQRRHRLPERGGAGAADHRRCRERVRHRGPRCCRRHGDHRRHGRTPAGRGAKPTELLQGSDGVASRQTDDDVPRGTTGKVDVRRLARRLSAPSRRKSAQNVAETGHVFASARAIR